MQDHKNIATSFINEVFNKKNMDAMDEYVGDVYVQHNPGLPDGKEPLKGMLEHISPNVEIVRSIAEGDLVVQHNSSTGWGNDMTFISFDIFRVVDGKIVEHWDIMQPKQDTSVSGRTQIDGETEVTDLEKTAANKAVVQGFFDTCIYGNQWDRVAEFISNEQYAQHNPHVGDGLSGLNDFMQQLGARGGSMTYDKTYRVVAEGNFVFVHSKGELDGKQLVFGDLMRVEDGKIVEHWDVLQDIPTESKNGHDMFEQVTD
jgi:predicted SnoaL-like aldol condensation-catalyzing enzyme